MKIFGHTNTGLLVLYLPASWNSYFSKLYTVLQMLWCCSDSTARAILNDGQEKSLGCGGWGGEKGSVFCC